MRTADAAARYDGVAPVYDGTIAPLLEGVLRLRRYRERTIDLLGELRGRTVLDVGCGTGPNFPLLAERVGPAGRVIGLDCSAGMLSMAARRIERHGWRNFELIRDDAVTLTRVEGPVDAVVSVWCYGYVDDLEAALTRAVDLLAPGGRLALMTFARSKADRGPLRALHPALCAAARITRLGTEREVDDAALERRWARGREVLAQRLGPLHEERHFHGLGLILASRGPDA